MRIRSIPAIATRLLKLFCSRSEDEFLIGDLVEKYQQGRGRFWYWRQVAGIVCLRLYRNARQLPLSAAGRQLKPAFTVILVVAALAAVWVSDIWIILPIGIFGGLIAGALISGLRNRASDHPLSSHPGISIHHIPVEGPAGLLFAVGTVFIFGVGVPAVREIFVLTVPLGLVALRILLYWHKHHSVKIEALNLHK